MLKSGLARISGVGCRCLLCSGSGAASKVKWSAGAGVGCLGGEPASASAGFRLLRDEAGGSRLSRWAQILSGESNEVEKLHSTGFYWRKPRSSASTAGGAEPRSLWLVDAKPSAAAGGDAFGAFSSHFSAGAMTAVCPESLPASHWLVRAPGAARGSQASLQYWPGQANQSGKAAGWAIATCCPPSPTKPSGCCGARTGHVHQRQARLLLVHVPGRFRQWLLQRE